MAFDWYAGGAVTVAILTLACFYTYGVLIFVSNLKLRVSLWALMWLAMYPLPTLIFDSETHVTATLLICALFYWWFPFRALLVLMHKGTAFHILLKAGLLRGITNSNNTQNNMVVELEARMERENTEGYNAQDQKQNLQDPSLDIKSNDLQTMHQFGHTQHLEYHLQKQPRFLAKSLAFGQFAACLFLPANLSTEQGKDHNYNNVPMCFFRAFIKLLVVYIHAGILIPKYWGSPVVAVLWAIILYAFASFIMDAVAIPAMLFLNLHVHANFNMPFLSCSLNEFWSRRWNLTACITLRDTIFITVIQDLRMTIDPQAKLCLFGQSNRRSWHILGVLASFFVSGAMHELIIGCVTHKYTYEWLLFFNLHGVICVFEKWVFTKFPRIDTLPRVIRQLVTLSILVLSAHFLFYPPALRSGVAKRALENIFQGVFHD